MVNNILQIYFTTNTTTRFMDWVSVCYKPGITESVANVACRQRGYVGAIRFSPANRK